MVWCVLALVVFIIYFGIGVFFATSLSWSSGEKIALKDVIKIGLTWPRWFLK